MSEPPVKFDNVEKLYGSQAALESLSLDVEPGERLALVGHNGAGKTTTMKLMLGLIRPSRGSVRVLGVDPAEDRAKTFGCSIGFLPESVAFHEAMTGRETLDFYARLKREPVRNNGALLEEVGLATAASRRVKTYSKGMRQRLGLAQALLGKPGLVLLDEPTTGLDPAFRQTFFDILQRLAGQGSTIVLSSHALSELETHTDRVAILSRGRLAASGTLAELGREARLKARIRVVVAPGQARALAAAIHANGALAHVNDRSVELTCPIDEKLELLRRIESASLPIEDIEVGSPRLDDVFAHYTERR